MVKSAVGQVSSLSFTFHHSLFRIQRCPRPNAAQRGFHPSSVGRFFSFIHHSLFTIHSSEVPPSQRAPFTVYPSPFLQATAVGSSEPAVASSVVALTGGLPGGAAGADPAVRDFDRTIRARCFSHHSRLFSIPSASRFIRRTK